jgi:hypothetical protein
MFTIEVLKKNEDEQFQVNNLEMFHEECGGGIIKITTFSGTGVFKDTCMRFNCQRCNDWSTVLCGGESTGYIAKTAIDGKPRRIRSYTGQQIKVKQKNGNH